jgi:methylmalonyl-CoA carboxyltransferase large subunit
MSDRNDTLLELQAEVRALSQRLQRLEREVQGLRQPIPEEDLYILAAAVAAYLGKRAPLRQVRLLGTSHWSQNGKISIQASHRLQGGP